jgi:hypothetical protein
MKTCAYPVLKCPVAFEVKALLLYTSLFPSLFLYVSGNEEKRIHYKTIDRTRGGG